MQSGGPARGRRVSERPYTLVYDGDCRFCAHSVDLVATWDRGETVEIVPFQRGGVHERFPWIAESAPSRMPVRVALRAPDGRPRLPPGRAQPHPARLRHALRGSAPEGPAYSGRMTSVRRFRARPSAVVFGATSNCLPKPCVLMRAPSTF